MHLPLIAAFALAAGPAPGDDPGTFVQALWLVQHHGTAEALDPANDQKVKGTLAKALAKDGELSLAELGGLIDADTFQKLAGSDGRIGRAEIKAAAEAAAPATRLRLLPKVKEHADFLTTSFDMIDEPHRLAGRKLAEWIAKNYQPGRSLDVVAVCSGNSRRSMMAATMGNVAAAYYGLPEVRFFSGGTAPTALNTRAKRALGGIGIEIEPTGKEADRGEPQTANPVYRLRWGTPGETGAPLLETIEFSKHYTDPANPQQGFAALMVCGEADEACPVVKGAALRVSMPYLDPKIYDGSPYETAKYAERRDDIGRLMLSVMMQARGVSCRWPRRRKGRADQMDGSLPERLSRLDRHPTLWIVMAVLGAVALGLTAMAAQSPKVDPPNAGPDDLPGRVVSESGAGVRDVQIWAMDGAPNAETVAISRTDGQGLFVIPQVVHRIGPPGRSTNLSVFARGRDGSIGWQSPVSRDSPLERTVEIELRAVGDVAGRLTDQNAEPIAGVDVAPVLLRPSANASLGAYIRLSPEVTALLRTRTAPDGSFVLKGIPRAPGSLLRSRPPRSARRRFPGIRPSR